MVYHQVTLGPSEGQMASLADGDAVHLPAKNFSGDIEFHLTTAQVKKIEKAHAAGRGCLLKLSPAQVKMMAQKGSGRFTDLLRQGYNIAKPALRQGLKKGIAMGGKKLSEKVQQGIESGSRRLEDKISDVAGLDGGWIGSSIFGGSAQPKVQRGKGFFGSLAKKAAHGAVDVVANQLGAGAKWTPPQKGKGFFGSLAKKAAHGAVDVVANQLGAGIPNHRANPNEELRAALNQKKVQGGNGIFLP
jgi:hypothetical protein